MRRRARFFPDSDGVRQAAEAVTHADLGWFFTKYVQGTEEIPWNDFFRSVGLSVVAENNTTADRCWLFRVAKFRWPDDCLFSYSREVKPSVPACTPEIQFQKSTARPPASNLRSDMAGLAPGDTITLKVRGRRGAEHELKWKVGTSRRNHLRTQRRGTTLRAEQRARRAAWLKGEAQVPQAAPSH